MQVGSNKTQTITTFWHRRLAEVAIFFSALVIILYFLPIFITLKSLGVTIVVHDWSMIIAAVVLIMSVILYLWVPKRQLTSAALSIYASVLVLAGSLAALSGGITSPFIAAWLAAATFSYAFSWGGPIIVSVLLSGYIGYMLTVSPDKHTGPLVTLAVLTAAVSIASFIIFHKKSRNEQIDDEYDNANIALSMPQRRDSKADVVIQAIDDGVLALDNKGTIQLMNPAAQRLLGWGRKDAEKLNYASVLKLSDEKHQKIEGTTDPVAAALQTNKTTETDKLFATTGGGKRILLSITVSPVGQMGDGVIIVFRDITRKNAEEREQAEFISTASHEMRTPVASIEGYLGLALNPQTATIDAKARDFIEKAHASAQHLGRLFQDLLDVSKADDGRLANYPKIVDVTAYLTDVVEGLRPKAEEKGLRLYYKPKIEDNSAVSRTMSPVYFANVDNDHLRETVANLTENAIKYTPQGDVVVDISGTTDFVTISIKDSGIGIAKEDIGHLFQKFYRIDNSATREIGGTGLGLYLCRRLAETMGGRVWAESELGKGSIFHLEIPRIDSSEAMRMIETESSEINAKTEASDRVFLPDATVTTDPLIQPAIEPPLAVAPQAVATPTPQQQPTPSAVAPAPYTAPQPASNNPPLAYQAPAAIQAQTNPAQQVNMSPTRQSTPTLSEIEQNPSMFQSSRAIPMQVPIRDTNTPPPPRA